MRRRESKKVAFIVDSMHGKLCRWLRILGFSAAYWVGGDAELLSTALREDRIILTSDVEIYRSALARGAEALLIRSRGIKDNLVEVARYMSLRHGWDPHEFLTPKAGICTSCNGYLSKVEGSSWLCQDCGKRFWVGSHWRGITRTLQAALFTLKGGER